MARRGSATVETTDENTTAETPEVEAVSTEAVEAEVTPEPAAEVTATDPEASTEVPATEERDTSGDTVIENGESRPATTEAAPEVEFDLKPFTDLAAEVVAGHDKATGALPEGGLDRVLAAYRELPDTKVRNRAKKALQEQVAKGIEALDMGVAKGYLTLHDNMKTTGAASGTPRQPADPKARWRQSLEVTTLAYGELYNQRPDGVEATEADEIVSQVGSLTEEMNSYRTWLDTEVAEGEEKPEAPKVDDRVIQAFRLARGGKVSGSRSGGGTSTPHDGPRRDIAKHILNAFADKASGDFLTVAEIRAVKSEEYGDEAPSAGAISARLFPASGTCTVEGVVPGTGGDKNQRGARKA